MKRILIVITALIMTIGTVHAEEGCKKEGDGKRKRDKHHGPDKQEILKKFDKDGDGKLSDEEKAAIKEAHKAEWEAKMLKKYDKDGDGALSDEEKAEAKKERHGKGKDEGKGKHGEEMKKQMLKKYDKDGDGTLSDEEKAEAKKAHHGKGKHGKGEKKDTKPPAQLL